MSGAAITKNWGWFNMKALNIVYLLFIFSVTGCAHRIRGSAVDAHFQRQAVIKIAALPAYINDDANTEVDMTYAVADEFLNAGWKVVDRSMVAAILKEQRFQASGAVEKNAAQIGKMTGANLVATGLYEPRRPYLHMRVIDVETGEIVATTTCYGKSALGPCAAKELVRLIQGGK